MNEEYEHLLPEDDRFITHERVLAEQKKRQEEYKKWLADHWVTVGQLKEYIANLPDDYRLQTYEAEYSEWDSVIALTHDDDEKVLRFNNWEVG